MIHTTLAQQKAQYKSAKVAYEAGKPIMSDAQFDKLEDLIRSKSPSWPELRKTGTAVKSKKMKRQLPKKMPSLNKRYPAEIGKWLSADDEDVVVMDKEDGSSLLLGLNSGTPKHLITRGDGDVGGDISFLLPYLNVPQALKYKAVFWLRCEAVMKEATFNKYYKDKYDNPRNLVAGILNRSMTGAPTDEEQLALKRTDIIVLGVFDTAILEGLATASRMGFTVVPHSTIRKPSAEKLTAHLQARRKASPYAMDGLVLAYPDFQYSYATNDKPKDIIAFKINAEADAVEAKVKCIHWQVTGHGRIVPKVEIEPKRIGGVTVKHATVHNAQWMLDRKIGPGATIKVVRSGDVIPKIVGVTKAGKIQLPEIPHKLEGKHFVVKAATAGTQERIDVLNMHKFMTTMGIELLGTKTLTTLQQQGFDSVAHYLNQWHRGKLVSAFFHAGLGEKTAANIQAQFDKAFKGKIIPMKDLMVASRCYPAGIGARKLTALENGGVSMDMLVASVDTARRRNQLEGLILTVHGFETTTAEAVIEGTVKFLQELEVYKRYLTIDGSIPEAKVKKVSSIQRLSGQVLAWTGYRDEDEEETAEDFGADVGSFGSRTTILLYKEGGKASTKVDKARAKGIKVMTWNELVKEYKL